MKVRVEIPRNLKDGDLIVSDYSYERVYLSKVERVIDNGKAVIVGKGGHAHRVSFENILCRLVGSNAQRARDAGAYITFKEDITKALADDRAVNFETFTQFYDRTHNRKET